MIDRELIRQDNVNSQFDLAAEMRRAIHPEVVCLQGCRLGSGQSTVL